MQITVALSPTYTFSAFCPIAPIDGAVECTIKTSDSKISDSKIQWNSSTGKFSLLVPTIRVASDLCWFSDSRLGLEEHKAFLQDKQLRVDLFPRKLSSDTYENLELVSGKIAIEDRGGTVTEGVILLFHPYEKLASAL